MIGPYVLLGFVAFCIWAFVSDYKENKANQKAVKFAAQKFLDEQNALPKYQVQVTTKSGNILHSRSFNPNAEIMWGLGGDFVNRTTSLDWAESSIEGFFKKGRYYDSEKNLFIPVCNIESIRAVQVQEA